MRFREALAGLGCLLLVSACQPTGSASGQPAPTETFTHESSGFHFPPSVGSFARETVKRYDQQGRDVSVGYNLGQSAAITVYVYPVGQGRPDDTLEGQFGTCSARS